MCHIFLIVLSNQNIIRLQLNNSISSSHCEVLGQPTIPLQFLASPFTPVPSSCLCCHLLLRTRPGTSILAGCKRISLNPSEGLGVLCVQHLIVPGPSSRVHLPPTWNWGKLPYYVIVLERPLKWKSCGESGDMGRQKYLV